MFSIFFLPWVVLMLIAVIAIPIAVKLDPNALGPSRPAYDGEEYGEAEDAMAVDPAVQDAGAVLMDQNADGLDPNASVVTTPSTIFSIFKTDGGMDSRSPRFDPPILLIVFSQPPFLRSVLFDAHQPRLTLLRVETEPSRWPTVPS